MKKATLYDEIDAVIDKIGNERPDDTKEILRDIRDRLPDEIDEITIVVSKENVVSDVMVNGKQTKCYCVVPKDQIQEYLEKRWIDL
jgi:hypothetical protein